MQKTTFVLLYCALIWSKISSFVLEQLMCCFFSTHTQVTEIDSAKQRFLVSCRLSDVGMMSGPSAEILASNFWAERALIDDFLRTTSAERQLLHELKAGTCVDVEVRPTVSLWWAFGSPLSVPPSRSLSRKQKSIHLQLGCILTRFFYRLEHACTVYLHIWNKV